MKFEEDIVCQMIRDYFNDNSNGNAWNNYPIRVSSCQLQDKNPNTIFVWYYITISTRESLNCIRIDKKEYEYRVSYKSSSERNRKIDSILEKRSFFDKIKQAII